MEQSTLSRAASQMLSQHSHKPKLDIDISPEKTFDKQQKSQANLYKITVQDVVQLTMKNNDVFGIEGYNLPRREHPHYTGVRNQFPKEKGKNFCEQISAQTKGIPGPGEYPIKLKWGSDRKAPSYITKKNTYIFQIENQEKGKPSPAEYQVKRTMVEKKVAGGNKSTSEGFNFLSDYEFLGNTNPSPQQKDWNPGEAKLKTLGRCISVINVKNEKPKDKNWKAKKNDIPGPGQYKELNKGYTVTLESSPEVKFKTSKRIGFAEEMAKNKNYVPSPQNYAFKEFKQEKIWRRITTKRH